MPATKKIKVGELNPSQILYSYGVGAIIDLPHISAIVSGLDDWPIDPTYVREIQEDRLLIAVKNQLGDQVKRLLSLPHVSDKSFSPDPFSKDAFVGVPVATFPQWMTCPECHILAPIQSELFELKVDYYRPDRTHYEHINCQKGKHPTVLPARFLVCCENGHLDDFPWAEYVHHFDETKYNHRNLSLLEFGVSGEARDLYVRCNECGAERQMAEAFGRDNRRNMPQCKGRRPHLHDYDPEPCENNMRAILLGASNIWFPSVLNTISIPNTAEKLENLVKENWGELSLIETIDNLIFYEKLGKLRSFVEFPLSDIWDAIQKERSKVTEAGNEGTPNLILPEWNAFISPATQHQTEDFRLREVNSPEKYSHQIKKVILAERIREVRGLVGFTRIDSPGEMAETEEEEIRAISPLSRNSPTWLPAIEVRGEGIFIQFSEEAIQGWMRKKEVLEREQMFLNSHIAWRTMKKAEKPEAGFPGLRYILLHSFSHALMRQFSMECGYSQASIRERIYSTMPGKSEPLMAGILIYTSAPDSEGTLGGLVNLGEPRTLGRHIQAALDASRLCASDPTCSEHIPSYTASTLNGAACHACLYSPETSCEKGNRYLDRTLLVPTVHNENLSFFNID
jgi:hypothetical protein